MSARARDALRIVELTEQVAAAHLIACVHGLCRAIGCQSHPPGGCA